jgi:hypothetical protein
MLYIKKINTLFRGALFLALVLLSFHSDAKLKRASLSQDTIVGLSCTETDCFFPEKHPLDKDLYVEGRVKWDSNKNLVLYTKGNIVFEDNAKIVSTGSGSIILKAGMEPGIKNSYNKAVLFKGNLIQIEILGEGHVKIYSNPTKGLKKHRYLNPDYGSYMKHIKAENVEYYLLINDVYDLQNIGAYLSGSYALSQDIDASETKAWNEGKGFEPLRENSMPFSGDFDGNGYSIKGLFINRKDEDVVGLFGKCGNSPILHNTLENVVLENFDISGDHYVGSLVGFAANTDLINIKVINSTIKSRDVAGGLIGTADGVKVTNVEVFDNAQISGHENNGTIVGSESERREVDL